MCILDLLKLLNQDLNLNAFWRFILKLEQSLTWVSCCQPCWLTFIQNFSVLPTGFFKLKKIFRQLNNLMSKTKNNINVRITETRIHICLFILKNDITSIMVIYNTVYYLLSGSDFNGHKFKFIKCTVYSKCQKKYKKT